MLAEGAVEGLLASPAGIAAVAVVSLLLTACFVYLLARVGYRLLAVAAAPVRKLSGLVPEGPSGVLAVLFVLSAALVFAVGAPLPDRTGTLGGDGASGTASPGPRTGRSDWAGPATTAPSRTPPATAYRTAGSGPAGPRRARRCRTAPSAGSTSTSSSSTARTSSR